MWHGYARKKLKERTGRYIAPEAAIYIFFLSTLKLENVEACNLSSVYLENASCCE